MKKKANKVESRWLQESETGTSVFEPFVLSRGYRKSNPPTKRRKQAAEEMASFRKWLGEQHPAGSKIEVSAVENKL
jgi:hypothetical protein